jgi:glycosyltransferase involved in cell wall biosynthesis
MICFDGRVLARKVVTGVERYAHEIYRALAKLTPIEVIQPQRGGRYFGHIWLHTALPLEAKRRNATALFCPVMDGPVLLDRKVRLCVTIHDVAFIRHPEMYNPGFRRYYQVMLPWIMRRADTLVCISNSEREHIEELYPVARGKTQVVYHGISHRFRVDSDEGKEPYILVVTSFNRHKNLVRLLLAFESVADRIPHKMVLIGSPRPVISSDHEADRIIERLERSGKVIRTGYISDDELEAWYRKADMFAFPSLFEGFGSPPLEAMAAGCIACCSSAPAMPEICGDAAAYFDPYSIEDIARTLVQVAHDEALRATLRKAGREWSQRFSWDKTAREMLAILK